ncbi:MAG TPA: NADPH:quinone reductase [Lactobacillus sp.]|nr:NADPH:quinone reductase [Lactobacillus sp.]
MKTVIIFDHPYTSTASENVPHQRSFLAAIYKQVINQLKAENSEVDLIDLHADHFDPVMSAEDLSNWRRGVPINAQVEDYQNRLLDADQIILMFPIWWEVMPAMMKGFLDKVYAKGCLYQAGSMQTKLVRQPKIKVITTMGTPSWIYRWVIGAPLLKALFRGTFLKTKLFHFKWYSFSQVEKKSLAQRQRLIQGFKL